MTAPCNEARGWRTVAYAFACAAIGAAIFAPAQPALAVGPTFDCLQAKVFLAQDTPTQLRSGAYGIGAIAFTPIGPAVGNYNSIAFNESDGYIYAEGDADNVGPLTNNVLQLDGTGAVHDTGVVVPGATNVGAFDGAGTYYLMSGSTATLRRFSVAASLLLPPVSLSAAPGIADFSFLGGYLWGHSGATFARIDPSTGTVTQFAQTAVPAGAAVGGSWTYGNGNLGFSDNNTGTVYQVRVTNPSSPSPAFSLVSSATGPNPPGQNDGTSCIGLPTDLGISKSTPVPVGPGDQLTWTLTVHNYGPGISSADTVTDTLPASITNVATTTPGCTVAGNTVTCVEGVLLPGAETTITITGTAPATPSTLIENTATVLGNDVDPNPANDADTSVTATRPASDLSLTKTASPSPAVPGRNLTYTLEVTNHGPDAAAPVTVTDTLPAGLSFVSADPGCAHAAGTVTCTLASLASGATHSFHVVAAVASSLTGSIANTAHVTSPSLDPDPDDNTATTTTPAAPSADLSLVKTAPPAVAPGKQLTYRLTVANSGPSDATAISVADPLPAGLSFVSASPGCTQALGTVTCTLASLASGASHAFEVVTTVAASASGAIANGATLSSATHDPSAANNGSTASTQVARTADLVVAKRASATSSAGNSPITWTVTVTNRGPDAGTGVVAIDDPSLPVTFSSVTTTGGTCTKVAPVRCELGTILAGTTVTIKLTGRPRTSGTLANSVRLTADQTDPQPGSNVARATTAVRGSLSIRKTANKRTVRAGRTIGYAIRVENRSSIGVPSVRVCDRLPSGLTFVSASPRATRSDGRYCWTVGTLAAKATRTVRITVRALRGARGRRTNTATVTGRGATARSDASPAVNVLAAGVRGGGVTG